MRLATLFVIAAGCSFRDGAVATSDGPPGDLVVVDRPRDGSGSASGRRKPITIDGSKVIGTHAGFPVWLDIVDPQLGAGARADGSDLYFTDASGAPLPYEIQRWNQPLAELTAWVGVTQVMQGVNTVIYVRYAGGNAPAPDPPAVFAAYSAVWHLDDSLATTTVADARGAYPGAAQGAGFDTTHSVAGQLGRGVDFDGTQDQITFTNMLLGNTPHTISAWVSERTASGFDAIVTLGTPAANQSRWFYAAYTTPSVNPDVAAGFYANDWSDAMTNVQNAGWTLLHWVYEGANTRSTMYRDGVAVSTHMFNTGTNNTTGTTGWIGYGPSGWGADNWLNGTLDELRISTTALGANWIATEFANQKSPATFYSVGAEQAVP